MSGLLLKDFYTILRYYKIYMIIVAVALIATVFVASNYSFAAYCAIMASAIPIGIIAVEEKERWNIYSATLPYSAAEIVSAKYVLSSILLGIMAVAASIFELILLASGGEYSVNEHVFLIVELLVEGLIISGVMFPFVFRFGAEKGRLVYFLICVVIIVAAISIGDPGGLIALPSYNTNIFMVSLAGGSAVILGVSWLLSIQLYKSARA